MTAGALWVGRVTDADDLQTGFSICQIGVVAQDSHIQGVSSGAAAAHPGEARRVDHHEAGALYGNVSVTVLDRHGVGWASPEARPLTSQSRIKTGGGCRQRAGHQDPPANESSMHLL